MGAEVEVPALGHLLRVLRDPDELARLTADHEAKTHAATGGATPADLRSRLADLADERVRLVSHAARAGLSEGDLDQLLAKNDLDIAGATIALEVAEHEVRRFAVADDLVALLFERPILLTAPGDVDGRSYTSDADEPRSEFDDVALVLSGMIRDFGSSKANDLDAEAVRWLRHIMEALDLAVVVKGPDPESWSIVPAAEVASSAPSRVNGFPSGGTSTTGQGGQETRVSNRAAVPDPSTRVRIRFTVPSLGRDTV